MNEMTACDEGGRVQTERAASGALGHPPSQAWEIPDGGRGVEVGAGPTRVLTAAQVQGGNGEMAICRRFVIPMGTALNKTKQHEKAATRQLWLLSQRFHVPPWSHRLTCSCGPGTT